jgi:hypothetical protein
MPEFQSGNKGGFREKGAIANYSIVPVPVPASPEQLAAIPDHGLERF